MLAGSCRLGGESEGSDELAEMVLCRRTSQLGGSPPRPGHRSGLRAWGRSRVLGRVGGAGPTVGAYRQPAARRGRRRWRALPRVHARRRSELGAEREGGGGRGRLASWASRGGAPGRSGRAGSPRAGAEGLLEAGVERQRARANRQGCAAGGVPAVGTPLPRVPDRAEEPSVSAPCLPTPVDRKD